MNGGRDPLLAPYRRPEPVHSLARAISAFSPAHPVRVMHVCGTHENAICQFGLRDLLPSWLRLIAGPGCPVCVCPAADIDMAVRLASEHDVALATFGDVVRVPARISLLEAKANGADVRVVYGIADAVKLARDNPGRQVAFFAVGFETTACTTAAALKRGVPPNFSVLVSHRLVPPALAALLALEGESLHGFILPGHVTTVAGLADYHRLGAAHSVPMAVAGFEPTDLLLSIRYLVERISSTQNGGESIFNAYARVVREGGNETARTTMNEVFEPCDAAWRGIGTIPVSGYRLRDPYRSHDAALRYGLSPDPAISDTHPACRCGEVLLGRVEPEECPLFGTGCHPDQPVGPCMVAFEGTCRARFRGGRGSARQTRVDR
jgi:hydrogenase expression/formation protein HypD